MNGTEPHIIDDNNFEALQKILRRVFCFNGGKNG